MTSIGFAGRQRPAAELNSGRANCLNLKVIRSYACCVAPTEMTNATALGPASLVVAASDGPGG
jgi:hypothetical protein